MSHPPHAHQPSFLIADWPVCPRCKVTMIFADVAIHDDDHDLRSFECRTCQHSERIVIAAKQAANGTSSGSV
jgi:hypothetical protein